MKVRILQVVNGEPLDAPMVVEVDEAKPTFKDFLVKAEIPFDDDAPMMYAGAEDTNFSGSATPDSYADEGDLFVIFEPTLFQPPVSVEEPAADADAEDDEAAGDDTGKPGGEGEPAGEGSEKQSEATGG